MRKRRKQRIIIGALCAVLVLMTVSYAALSQLLTITGTSNITGSFEIQITGITENTMTGATTISTGGLGTTTASFEVDLEKPGSSAIYDVTVENKGTIDAILTSIEGIDEANSAEPRDIVYRVSGIKKGDTLLAKESKNFQIKAEYKNTATSIPTTNKKLTLKLNYEQKTESAIPGTVTASDYLLANALSGDILNPTNGLYAIDNTGELTTSSNPREYRYIGANPDNYIQFNNELWRIIGIFDGQLKIIRKDSLGDMEWDSNNVNDWSQATLQTYLNGEYLNSMDAISQGYIDNYTWKLGGSSTYDDVTAQMFYERERGTAVFEGRPTEWVGKIALMYLSDYGFATSGGSTTNRTTCLAKELINWDADSFSDCRNNSWLSGNDASDGQYTLKGRLIYSPFSWTLTPYAGNATGVFFVDSDGVVYGNHVNDWNGVRPSLNLLSSVEIATGVGTEENPFILR